MLLTGQRINLLVSVEREPQKSSVCFLKRDLNRLAIKYPQLLKVKQIDRGTLNV